MPSCEVQLVALMQLQVRLQLLLLLGPKRKLQAQPAWSLVWCNAACAQRMLSRPLCLYKWAMGVLVLWCLLLRLHSLRTAVRSTLLLVLACEMHVVSAVQM